jgi:hypothetical protein
MTTVNNPYVQIDHSEAVESLTKHFDTISLNPTTDMSFLRIPQVSYAQMFGMRRLHKTITIKPNSTELFQFAHNFFEVKGTFPMTPQVYNNYVYIKYNVKFDFELESNFQQVGAIILYFDNRWGGVANYWQSGTSTDLSPITGTYLPHDFMALGHNGNLSLTLPWNCNRKALSMFNTNDHADLTSWSHGKLHVDMFQPMIVAAGVPDEATLRVFISLVDVELSGYIGEDYQLS